jgi:hypothetical protein
LYFLRTRLSFTPVAAAPAGADLVEFELWSTREAPGASAYTLKAASCELRHAMSRQSAFVLHDALGILLNV